MEISLCLESAILKSFVFATKKGEKYVIAAFICIIIAN